LTDKERWEALKIHMQLSIDTLKQNQINKSDISYRDVLGAGAVAELIILQEFMTNLEEK
jgi:hypothetical protein